MPALEPAVAAELIAAIIGSTAAKPVAADDFALQLESLDSRVTAIDETLRAVLQGQRALRADVSALLAIVNEKHAAVAEAPSGHLNDHASKAKNGRTHGAAVPEDTEPQNCALFFCPSKEPNLLVIELVNSSKDRTYAPCPVCEKQVTNCCMTRHLKNCPLLKSTQHVFQLKRPSTGESCTPLGQNPHTTMLKAHFIKKFGELNTINNPFQDDDDTLPLDEGSDCSFQPAPKRRRQLPG